jgi:hypothetical protein
VISLNERNGIYSLVKIFDRTQFPSNLTDDLNSLLKDKLIRIEKNFDNGTPSEYGITKDGVQYLDSNLKINVIIEYIKTMDDPELILNIVQNNNKRKNGL